MKAVFHCCRSKSPLLALFCVLILAPAALLLPQSANSGADSPQGPTLKVSVNVVNVYAVVREKKRLIPDLSRDDFEVTEDDVPQQIRYFSRQTDTPLTLVLAVDTSPSQERVLAGEQQAAKQFAGQVLRPKDEFAVIHFDLEVELLQDFTSDLEYLTRAIDETQINGGGAGPLPGTFPNSRPCCTHLYDAVYLASAQMLKNEAGRKVIILVTDGQDEGSSETLDRSLEAAQKADVIIYSILLVDRGAYGGMGFGYSGESALSKLSTETGGRVIRADNPHNTAEAFQEIASELRTQYLLGYTPSNNKNDGTFRRIRVRVKQGHYDVQARRGYYAPSQ
jgi:VWFA-related protein